MRTERMYGSIFGGVFLALGRHLEATVRTGTYCSYLPDPRVPIIWVD